jgi:hypothetical protein
MSELYFWVPLFFLGMLAFRWWANNVPPRKDWNADADAVSESRMFATGYNRLTESALPTISGDYDARPFALDGDAA